MLALQQAYLEQLQELDPMLDFLHGRQLDALLDGMGRLEWWLETSDRLSELIEIVQRVRDDELGI